MELSDFYHWLQDGDDQLRDALAKCDNINGVSEREKARAPISLQRERLAVAMNLIDEFKKR